MLLSSFYKLNIGKCNGNKSCIITVYLVVVKKGIFRKFSVASLVGAWFFSYFVGSVLQTVMARAEAIGHSCLVPGLFIYAAEILQSFTSFFYEWWVIREMIKIIWNLASPWFKHSLCGYTGSCRFFDYLSSWSFIRVLLCLFFRGNWTG